MRPRGRVFRKMSKVVIDSTKNIFQFNPTPIASLAVNVQAVAIAVPPNLIDETDVTKTANVEEGSEIRQIDLDFRLYHIGTQANTTGSAVLILRKNEGLAALPAPTLGQMNSLGAQVWKARIFFSAQAIAQASYPMAIPPIIVPKRFRTMHANDKWELIVANNDAAGLILCGMAHYKWYK